MLSPFCENGGKLWSCIHTSYRIDHNQPTYWEHSSQLPVLSLSLYLKSQKCKQLLKNANRVDPDEEVHNELSHLDLHCLLCSL